MSKFDGKFRNNKDYQEYNENSNNFIKIRKRKTQDNESKRVVTKNYNNNHKRYDFLDN